MSEHAANLTRALLVARLEAGHGDRVAIHTEAGDVTYREVHDRAMRFAGLLRARGVRPEERVIVALRDGVDWVAAFFGVIAAGGVVVMVNPDLKPDAIRYFLGYTRARALVVDADDVAPVEEAWAMARSEGDDHLRELLVVGDPDTDRAWAGASPLDACFASHPDDPAIWLFSGGTTGRPKAVVQPHRSFHFTTRAYGQKTLGLTADDVTLSVPKLYFGYATGSNLLFPFSVGGRTVLFPDRCTPERIVELCRRFRPTVLINVPTLIRKLLDVPDVSRDDLASLRLATSAGEALPPELHARWDERFGVDLLDGLGTAEMWHVFVSNRPGDVRPGTLGTVVDGFELRVRAEDGRDLPDGETGYLWVRGGARAIGYWQAQEKSEAAFRGEWYVSGDMITRDADGVFTYAGRADDMLKVSGRWLATREVEECLATHPGVREAAVVGVPDDHGLVKPWAFIDASDPVDTLPDTLTEYATGRLERYKVPRRIILLDEMPRTHLGKVDRGKLRTLATEGAAS